METALDFSLAAMFANVDDPAPSVEITVPVLDDAGTMFASVYDAARFYHFDARRVETALRRGTKYHGVGFRFPKV